MTIRLIIFALIILSISCFSVTHSGNIKESVDIIYKYPVTFGDDSNKTKFFYLTDTISKYLVDKYIIYKLSAVTNAETEEKIPKSSPYFVYKSGSKYGYLFRTISQLNNSKKLLIDSFVRKNAFEGMDVDITKYDFWHFLSSEEVANSRYEIDKYINDSANNFNEIDTLYYYYDRALNNIPFTFSGKLDSAKNSKLFKTRLVFNEETYGEGIVMPLREVVFEVRLSDNPDYAEIENLILKSKDSVDY